MRRAALTIVATIASLVLLLSFKTHRAALATAPVVASATGTTSTPAAPPASPTTAGGTTSGTRTVTGDSIDTRWGPVQVQITLSGGVLTAVKAVDYPWNNGRDQEINSYAIPQLDKEALAARSAQIDMVSGATYTSDGYIRSLQSALDKAA